MADLVKFVSKSELDAKKVVRREARESVLRKAKENYEKKERELEEKKKRGEDVWMLPSLSKRLSGSSSDEELSKKRKNKSGKKKKKKKKKSKNDSDKDEWVEKDEASSSKLKVNNSKSGSTSTAPQRDSWMMLPISSEPKQRFPTVEKDKVALESSTSSKEIPTTTHELGQHPRELNPYWKTDGSGLPSEAKPSDKGPASGNRAWFKRAYERAKQQAEDEGRSLEDVAAERWGSLAKLKALARIDEDKRYHPREKHRGRHETKDENRTSKDNTSGHREYEKDHKGRGEKSSDRRHVERRGFRRPDEGQREKIRGLIKPSDEDKSSTWDKKYESYRNDDTHRRMTSGRWRKTAKDEVSEKTEPKSAKEHECVERLSGESLSSSSSDETEIPEKIDEDRKQQHLMSKRVTETELNDLGAKRLKAELMGNEELAQNLEAQLDKLRKVKEKQEESGVGKPEDAGENVVVLTRTDRSGNVVPVGNRSQRENNDKRRKRHKNVSTHDEEGKRQRYFCDDDDYDLNSLVAREKMSTAEDHNATYARLAHKLGGQFDLDDKFESAAASKYTPEELEEKARQKAIREHQRLAAQMEHCKYCLDSRDVDKHLIIAIGLKVYLALPSNQSLSDGHCFLIPIMHYTAGTMVDEDIWSEIQIFKKGLTKLFQEMGKDIVFMEMNRNLHKQYHMMVECVPIDKEIGEMAPIYFKKAIMESDTEWAQNKKLIDTRNKNLRSMVPKGLPYFSVEFGLDGGFAHVIENENLVPSYFGKEIVGGMLELEPFLWKKPRKENFQVQKKKVLQFAEWWKPYDWTQKIKSK